MGNDHVDSTFSNPPRLFALAKLLICPYEGYRNKEKAEGWLSEQRAAGFENIALSGIELDNFEACQAGVNEIRERFGVDRRTTIVPELSAFVRAAYNAFCSVRSVSLLATGRALCRAMTILSCGST